MVKFKRNGLYIHYYSDRQREIEAIEEALTFFVEGSNFSRMFKMNRWDGFSRFYEKRYRRFKYGHLNFVCEALNKKEIEYKIENDFKPLVIDSSKLNSKLFQHQVEAVTTFSKKPYGIVKVPTRGGKTFLSGELIRIGDFEQVIFIVDNQLLFKQAVDDLSSYLNVKQSEIGKIFGDQFEIKHLTVASIQTMQSIMFGVKRMVNRSRKKIEVDKEKFTLDRKRLRHRTTQLTRLLEAVDFMIVDECHEYSSDERISILMKMQNAKAALFLSATPRKSENEIVNIRLESITGSILYEVQSQTLKDRGILSQENILLIMINHNSNRNILLREEDGYAEFEREVIIKNERRNNIIVNITQILQSMNLKTLVLFQKIEHGRYIQNITGYEYLTGSTKLHLRVELLKRFNKRKTGILLASNIFNKGLTLSSTEVMMNAGGGLERSTVIQKKGRVLGVTATKTKAMIIDFVDNYEYFNEHSLSRIITYEQAVGIENIQVLDSADPEFYQDMREYLSNWKNED